MGSPDCLSQVMKNKILISQTAIGPTYNRRLLSNLKDAHSYNYFDIIVLSNDIKFFDEIKNKPNIILKDIDEIRSDYPWSLELEVYSKEKIDEMIYAKELMQLREVYNKKFPHLLSRFGLAYEKREEYDGFIMMDCDVIPSLGDVGYEKLYEYFVNPKYLDPIFGEVKTGCLVTPSSIPMQEPKSSFMLLAAKKFNEEYNITDKEITNEFVRIDCNIYTLKFSDKSKIKIFFDVLNLFIHDLLKHKHPEYEFLTLNHNISMQSEDVLSIVFKLLDINTTNASFGNGLDHSCFYRTGFKEDKFWDYNPIDFPELKKYEKFYRSRETYYYPEGQRINNK